MPYNFPSAAPSPMNLPAAARGLPPLLSIADAQCVDTEQQETIASWSHFTALQEFLKALTAEGNNTQQMYSPNIYSE